MGIDLRLFVECRTNPGMSGKLVFAHASVSGRGRNTDFMVFVRHRQYGPYKTMAAFAGVLGSGANTSYVSAYAESLITAAATPRF